MLVKRHFASISNDLPLAVHPPTSCCKDVPDELSDKEKVFATDT